MGYRDLIRKLDQWRWAPEFRIEAPGELGDAMTAILARVRRAESERTESAPEVHPAPPKSPAVESPQEDAPLDLSDKVLVELGNLHARMTANVAELTENHGDSRPLRSVRRSIARIEELLGQYQIECRDLTGQTFTPGRKDLELIEEPKVREGIDRMLIDGCDRPAIFRAGKLLQTAKVLVVKPSPTKVQGASACPESI